MKSIENLNHSTSVDRAKEKVGLIGGGFEVISNFMKKVGDDVKESLESAIGNK
jgi:hypothetical protein